MPEQGPRAPLGDQGGRGAFLNPIQRLTLAGAGVIAGGALIAAGSRLAWATATLQPSAVNAPGLPPVVLAGEEMSFDASALGAGYLFGLGLLLALVPLGWLVAGPRARVGLGVVAIAIAGVALWQAADIRSELRRRVRVAAVSDAKDRTRIPVTPGPGTPVTLTGAALAVLAAVGGATVGGRAPRLGLPERPPPEDRR